MSTTFITKWEWLQSVFLHYTNQMCDYQCYLERYDQYRRWIDGAHSDMFKGFNSVKQGSVISPLLFRSYNSNLFLFIKTIRFVMLV